MPFYVSPEQLMRDKADYARKGVARSRSSVVLQYADGILMVTPNASSVLHKISELYDRIAFAAVGRYNEYETLRKAGVTYADVTGYQFDRGDVTARGVANWYAQTLGGIATDSSKPYEVEIVVAEVGTRPDADQIYRITWDGSVTDEPGFVAFGGQADQVAAALKERFSDGMSLTEALGAALDALAGPPASSSSSSASTNSEPAVLNAAQLEVAILDRARAHRTFRRLRGPRLEEVLAESRAAAAAAEPSAPASEPAPDDPASGSGSASGSEPGAGSGSGSGAGAGSGVGAGSGSAAGSVSGSATASRPKSAPPSDEPPTGPAPGGKDGIPKPPPAK
jgi:proteasome alpha subunit